MLDALTPSLLRAHPRAGKRSGDAERRILVVDDDPAPWAGLICILLRCGVSADISPRIPESLLSGRPATPICLILDLRPGRDGLRFQQRLAAAGVFVPIIFVAEASDTALTVKAMKNGAIDFFGKPFRDSDLSEAVEIGLARDQAWCDEQRSLSLLRSRFETLSLRERQVMAGVVQGKLNKQVAFDLSISEITVKAHRGKVMRKMNAMSLPELARMADRLAHACPWRDDAYRALAA